MSRGFPVDKQSKDRSYQTPPAIRDAAASYFPGGVIPLDPFTSADNPMRALDWCHPEGADGYLLPWHAVGGVFVNPPYGRPAIEKIGLEAAEGCEMVALLPVNRNETSYFQRLILERARVVCWIRRRVAFIRPSTGERASGNPYTSALWGFNVDVGRFVRAFGRLGVCTSLQVVAPTPTDLVEW